MDKTKIEQEFLSPKQLAIMLGLTHEGLRRMRREKRGPVFYKPAGEKTIYYKKAEVLAWMNAGRRDAE